jgi:hypothetical protein
MLSNQSAKLHNAMVFKSVLCILVGAFFSWYLPISNQELDRSIRNIDMAKKDVERINNKLKYFESYKGDIESLYSVYMNTVGVSSSFCKTTAGLASVYESMGERFRLRSTPITEIYPTPKISKFYDSKHVEIISNLVKLSFSSQGFRHAMSFARAAYEALPPGSTVDAINIINDNVLTMDSVNQLSASSKPQFIESQILMQLREVRSKSTRGN